MRSMQQDRASSLFFLGIGIFVIITALRLGLGKLTNPGPGFVIFGSGLLLLILSIIVFIRSKLSHSSYSEKIPALWKTGGWKKVVVIVASLFLYSTLFERLGYLLMTTMLMVFLMKMMRVRWRNALFWAILSTFIMYIGLGMLLDLQLPKGIMWF
jgi:putative tricarboxylic transport membrane protein